MSGGQDSRDITALRAPDDGTTAEGPPSSSEARSWTPDLDGLLCALVLAPGTYSRNRFFRMFEAAGARRIRRRATHVRSVLRSLRDRGSAADVLPLGDVSAQTEDVEIAFQVPSLGLSRRTRLAPLELALVRYALKIGTDEVRARDKAAVEGSLARLAPVAFT